MLWAKNVAETIPKNHQKEWIQMVQNSNQCQHHKSQFSLQLFELHQLRPPMSSRYIQKKCIIWSPKIQGNDITWHAPCSLEELAKLKSDFPDAKLITGNTECRLEQKFRKIEYAKQIYTRGIKEICQINVTDDFIEIGSGIEFSTYGR